jgi:hypothetical protein
VQIRASFVGINEDKAAKRESCGYALDIKVQEIRCMLLFFTLKIY